MRQSAPDAYMNESTYAHSPHHRLRLAVRRYSQSMTKKILELHLRSGEVLTTSPISNKMVDTIYEIISDDSAKGTFPIPEGSLILALKRIDFIVARPEPVKQPGSELYMEKPTYKPGMTVEWTDDRYMTHTSQVLEVKDGMLILDHPDPDNNGCFIAITPEEATYRE